MAQVTHAVVKRRPSEAKTYGPHLVGALVALLLNGGGDHGDRAGGVAEHGVVGLAGDRA